MLLAFSDRFTSGDAGIRAWGALAFGDLSGEPEPNLGSSPFMRMRLTLGLA